MHKVFVKAMQIPALRRRRKVWVWLPDQYNRDEKRRYPVLYMQDAQNLFEPWRAAFGQSWNLHHSLLAPDMPHCIIIAIEHGGHKRISEYRPWNEHGRLSEGDLYADFVAQKLKPFVDKKLRTLREREYTGIMGSSMGGLISLYTAIKHQEIFGSALIFSPSFWICPQIYPFAQSLNKNLPSRFYFLVGQGEGHQTVAKTKAMHDTISAMGFESKLVIRLYGTHTESFWAREFPAAYHWFHNRPTSL